jgi:hypothetical protein
MMGHIGIVSLSHRKLIVAYVALQKFIDMQHA